MRERETEEPGREGPLEGLLRPIPYQLRRAARAPEFIRRLWNKGVEDDIFFMAGAIAFNLLVALIPLVLLGIGVVGYVLNARFPDPSDAVLALVSENLPQVGGDADLAQAIRAPVSALVDQRSGITLFGAVFFIWVSTRLVGSLRIVLREIFDIGGDRGIVRGKIFDVQMVLVGLALLTLNLGVTVAFEAAMDFGVSLVGLDQPVLNLTQRLTGHALAFASIWTLFLLIYRYLPARRIPWRTALIAATFTGVMYEALKTGFSWYATEVANYGTTFGNLATVAVLFFWIYYMSVVFILGGEISQVYTMRKASRVQVRTTYKAEE